MEVTVISVGHSAEQFAFLEPLIKALQNAKGSDVVYFPDIGCSREAEIVLEEKFNHDNWPLTPYAELTYRSTAAECEMRYKAEVCEANIQATLGTVGIKGFRLVLRASGAANKKIRPTGTFELRTVEQVARQIANSFALGAAYRVIKKIPSPKSFAKEPA